MSSHPLVALSLAAALFGGCSTPMIAPPADAGAPVGDAGPSVPDAFVSPDAFASPDAFVSPDAGPVGFADMLAGLGVDTALPDFPSGVPSTYNPLHERFTTINPHVELYFAGWTDDDTGHQREGLLDDDFAPALHAARLLPSDSPWNESAAQQRSGVAIDVDGDGFQEVAVVYYNQADSTLRLRVIDGTPSALGTGYAASTPRVLASSVTHRSVPNGWLDHAAVAANVDDDDAQELLFAYGDLYVFDDEAHGFAQLAGSPIAYGSDCLAVAAGDFNGAPGDHSDELVVAHVSAGHVATDFFDGTTHTGSGDTLFNPLDSSTANDFTWAFLRAGNFNGDAMDEIAFEGRTDDGGSNWRLAIMDDATTSYAWFRSFGPIVSNGAIVGQYGNILTDFEVLDANGDGVDDIAVTSFLYYGLDHVPASSSTAPITSAQFGQPTGVGRVSIAFSDLSCIASLCVPTMATHGQFSSTAGVVGRDQLIAAHFVNGDLYVGSLDGDTWSWHAIASGSDGDTLGGMLVAANLDDDSAILRFTGTHELQFTDPTPVALLSAAPCYDASSGEMQDLGNCSTSFGDASTMSTTVERSYGEAVSWSIGYEADLFGVATASFTTTFEQDFERTAATTHSVTQSITYTAGEEDSVVFSVVPFDVYYYTIVSAPIGHASEIGHILSLDFPRPPQTLLVTQAFYDAHDGTLRDTASMFAHTVGMPHSYPTRAMADATCAGSCFQVGPVTVGEGSGYVEASTTVTMGVLRRDAFTSSIELASEVSAGGVTIGHSQRYSHGTALEMSTETQMVLTGRVGNVAHTPYQFGLFARPVPFGVTPTLLVDYWVQ